ncbi:hypothetical protein CAL7716_008300 [Calothrix sp. PCC 7716]|nr:hypothetical protein CAL7716_008300 [Calothrix sp. PCC 7716]
MQEVLNFIEAQKKYFAQLPLFDFMQDKSIDPKQRISFAPCMAHYVMSFSDLNKYVLRTDETDDILQNIINVHTNEDDEHWPWYIWDMQKLNLNPNLSFTKTLEFIWGEETKITRQIAYQIAGCTLQASPIVKIAVIEALEAMGHVFCAVSAQVASELEAITKTEYQYFGHVHLDAETGHTVGTPDAGYVVAELKLTEQQRQEALNAVEKTFKIFSEWTYELLAYAQNHPMETITDEKYKQVLAACK